VPNHVTIADVAREAGVSLMTVSRVVNNKEGVGAETRSSIEEIIKKLGYRPSSVARSLATQLTGTLGLVVPDNSNPFFSGVARGVEKVAFAEGYSVLLCNTEENPQREFDVLELLLDKWVDGLVLCSSRLDQPRLQTMLSQYPAAVLINCRLDNPPETLSIGMVSIDDRSGGQIATHHLIERGHRSIGFLSGPVISQSGQGRAEGYRAALAEAGIPYSSDLVLSCFPTVEGGQQATVQLLTDHPEVTALFCYNDLVAVGALQACKQIQRDVPKDLAIIGFDDILLAPLVTPSLTTIRIDQKELGESAARLLINRLNGCTDGCEKITSYPQLIVRASAP
jgi:LacI family transcriptional regulator